MLFLVGVKTVTVIWSFYTLNDAHLKEKCLGDKLIMWKIPKYERRKVAVLGFLRPE